VPAVRFREKRQSENPTAAVHERAATMRIAAGHGSKYQSASIDHSHAAAQAAANAVRPTPRNTDDLSMGESIVACWYRPDGPRRQPAMITTSC
jgi:hypothetical protein